MGKSAMEGRKAAQADRAVIFRDGKPRVTETLDNHFMTRGTGHTGTGVYGYGTEERATRNAAEAFKIVAPGVKLFDMNKNFSGFKIDPSSPYWSFKRFSEKMNGAALARTTGKERWYGESIKDLEVSAVVGGDNFGFSEDQVKAAIAKSAEQAKLLGRDKASQPINHLLLSAGFGGVDPGPKMRDDNSIGIVLFREAVGNPGAKEMENVDMPFAVLKQIKKTGAVPDGDGKHARATSLIPEPGIKPTPKPKSQKTRHSTGARAALSAAGPPKR